MEDGRVTEYAYDGGLDDLFDHIDDLLDFSNDNELGGIGMTEELIPFSPLSLPLQGDNDDDIGGLLNCNDNSGSSDVLFAAAANAIASATNFTTSHEEDCNSATNLQQQQQVEDELDIIPLEWMSQFLEESDSLSLSFPNQFDDGKGKEDCFRTSSPISVLEQPKSQCISNGNGNSNGNTKSFSSSSSSSSSSASSFSYCNSTNYSTIQEEEDDETVAAAVVGPVCSNPIIISAVPARTRTKRPRPTAVAVNPHPRIAIPIPMKQEQTNSLITTPSSDPESIDESHHPAPMRKRNKTKKKVNPEQSFLYGSDADDEYATDGGEAATNVRKCQHCQITKTPQWRAGPMGPKTLCNACGVRYKSGRLFPEYRPAASPTFVPSIHSNSHKRVVEMRNKTINTANSCDLLNFIRKSQKMSLLN